MSIAINKIAHDVLLLIIAVVPSCCVLCIMEIPARYRILVTLISNSRVLATQRTKQSPSPQAPLLM